MLRCITAGAVVRVVFRVDGLLNQGATCRQANASRSNAASASGDVQCCPQT